jgi:hypothetical protein
MTAQTRPSVLDMIEQLCAPHAPREDFDYEMVHPGGSVTKYTTAHTITAPALINQLRASVDRSTSAEGGSGSFKSKPAARIDAIDAYVRIDLAAARWVRNLGEDDPGDTITCLRKLAGLRASADAITCKALDRDVASWYYTARILTGWDTPALTPYNTCPPCGALGTLRVRPGEKIALCTGCHNTWDETNIGVLGEHIRAENGEDAA